MAQPKKTDPETRNTARFNVRTRPHVKALIQRAAALSGVDDTAFIMNAAYDAAARTIERHERIVLTGADAAAVLAAIDNPPPPTEKLKAAMKRHRETIKSDVTSEW
jgi:uncharacterized protein (DUF1778 family)